MKLLKQSDYVGYVTGNYRNISKSIAEFITNFLKEDSLKIKRTWN